MSPAVCTHGRAGVSCLCKTILRESAAAKKSRRRATVNRGGRRSPRERTAAKQNGVERSTRFKTLRNARLPKRKCRALNGGANPPRCCTGRGSILHRAHNTHSPAVNYHENEIYRSGLEHQARVDVREPGASCKELCFERAAVPELCSKEPCFIRTLASSAAV